MGWKASSNALHRRRPLLAVSSACQGEDIVVFHGGAGLCEHVVVGQVASPCTDPLLAVGSACQGEDGLRVGSVGEGG